MDIEGRPPTEDLVDLQRRHADLGRRYAVELRLLEIASEGGGIGGLVREVADLSPNPVWLTDRHRRVVARSTRTRGSDFKPPDIEKLLAHHGPLDLAIAEPLVMPARPDAGIMRRHLVIPIRKDDSLFAWLIMAEVSGRFSREDAAVLARAAYHLANEYAVQRRVARASWNARATLARQLVRGYVQEDDLASAADYLGVQADADRVLVFIGDSASGADAERHVVARVGEALGVEVLGSRGREGILLLIEAPENCAPVAFVQQVKGVMRRVVSECGRPLAAVGVSAVTRANALHRAYREAREVVLCVDRFAGASERVIAVDDLGPARLFVANSDLEAVRRYVHDVVGALIDGGATTADLLRTLQCFFDTGRSVRESAARLGVHENTVRLRLAKVHDLTGLEVASDANDQLAVQSALLVLRLEGHPAIPPFAERHAPDERTRRTPQTA